MELTHEERADGEDVGRFQFGERAAHVVEFRLGAERCAIDIDAVDGIVEMKQVTRVPRAPEAVDGVIDLRGETTAVVDPKTFLSVGEAEGAGNVLVLDREGDKQKIGIRVDEVIEVTGYRDDQVDENGQLEGLRSSAIETDLIKGIIRKPVGEFDDDGNPEDVRLILWFDVAALMAATAADRPSESDEGVRGSDTHA